MRHDGGHVLHLTAYGSSGEVMQYTVKVTVDFDLIPQIPVWTCNFVVHRPL